MDDFDALLDLDAAAVAAGAEAGRAAAAASSTRDGFTLGYTKGGELAVEVRLEVADVGHRSAVSLPARKLLHRTDLLMLGEFRRV
jgi:hypothetical protein|eukprot:COSAG02_NODE_8841_length_2424_cov_2.467527_3_plen_85_part_00